MMIGEFRSVEGRGSPNFLFADHSLDTSWPCIYRRPETRESPPLLV